ALRRSTGNRDPLAPPRIPPLLAFDLRARTRATADLGGDQEAHRPDGKRESLAGPEDPSRAVEARDRGESCHDLALPPQDETGSGFPATLDHLPAQSPRRDRRHGLLRRSDGPLPSSLRLVRDRSRATADPSLQRDREPSRSVGHPAATQRLP